jgi:FG-GAP-like repeat
MKKLHYFACLVLSAAFALPAFGNHRTGTLALPELLVAVDLNEDGKLDLAVNVTGFDNIAILIGNGLGGFTLNGHIQTDTLPKGLSAGDLNRDHHIDLVGCSNWGYDAEVHLGDGLGGFGPRDNWVRGEGGPNRTILADFNNDRKLDLAVSGPDEGVLLIYFGDGKGGFNPFPSELEDLLHCDGFTAADLNGDGKQDLAVVTHGQQNSFCHIFLGDGTGNFSTGPELSVNQDAATVAAVDLNNDGKLDLVVAGAGPENTTGNFILTFLGDGTGNFTLKQTTLLGRGAIKGLLGVADFNEDGKADVAYPLASTQIHHDFSTDVLIFLGDGTGNLVQGTTVTSEEEPHTVVATDLNGDGHVDLAVSNRTSGTVTIHLGNGTGTFTKVASVSVVCEGGVCQ